MSTLHLKHRGSINKPRLIARTLTGIGHVTAVNARRAELHKSIAVPVAFAQAKRKNISSGEDAIVC